VTASDRLWQMDIMRRRALGETAEIFGSLALEDDKVWRRYGFRQIAEDNLKYLSPELRSALDRYAAGVNAYIATLTEDSMPVEFKLLQYRPREWRAADTIAIGKVLAEALSTTWRQDLQRATAASLPPDKFKDLTNQVTPFDVVFFGNDIKSEPGAVATGLRSVPPAVVGGDILPSQAILRSADNLMAIRDRSLAAIGLYAEDLAASNNWVISGKLTADGKAILANDPHLAATAPGIWYLAHLTTPSMRVAGVTLPGVPGIILGHNENFAWGATNVGPDVQDLYVETFDEQGRYKTPTGFEPAVIRKEEIKVRKTIVKPDTDTITLDVVETRNGPVILEDGGKKYALKWTARNPQNSEFEAFFNLNRGKNWEDFKSALLHYGGPAQNFVYADTRGNIGWYAASRIPIRRSGSGEFPYDGSTNDGEWLGFIPFNELPSLYNPPSGLIVTANQRTVGTSYKYFKTIARDAAPPWRARRIYDLLRPETRPTASVQTEQAETRPLGSVSNSQKAKLTMDDVRNAQHDIYNIPLHGLAKRIVNLNAATPQTIAVLKDWDGMMRADSKAAVLANEIRNCMANRIADANKPAPASAIRERILYWAVAQKATKWLPPGVASYEDLIKTCDETSRASLASANRLGSDESNWRWENVFRARFIHPLAAAPLIGGQFLVEPKGVNGSGQTPNVGPSVSMRHISSPGNWDATRFVIPLGQSGDPKSPYFRDQFEMWNTGTPAIFPFSKTAIETASKTMTTFQPST
ncbi:MAG TPA: penicillin acylase family protein, partial [Pyrinomonadaceae bacterium]|nr:penicillin acylase family protein [Pyrinomonadaceae bacterium]